jgi:PHD/YefM family antitoxin component YafN of YafNO toxin-antitoxin module
MIEITQDEFEKNFDAYMDRVENDKELFLIRMPDGRATVMMPADELNEITTEIGELLNDTEITD